MPFFNDKDEWKKLIVEATEVVQKKEVSKEKKLPPMRQIDQQLSSQIYLNKNNEALKNKEIKIPGLSEHIKKQLNEILMFSMLNGKGIEAIEREIRNLLHSDFEWPEFDKWCKIFKENNDWPYLWEDIGYYYKLQEGNIKDLLNELKKEQLLSLNEKYQINAKKSSSKDDLIEKISVTISSENKNELLNIATQNWYQRFLKRKRILLCHFLVFSLNKSIEFIKNQYPIDIVEYIKIITCDNSCSICKMNADKKYKLSTLKEENLPPYHIGCRCCTTSVVKSSYSLDLY